MSPAINNKNTFVPHLSDDLQAFHNVRYNFMLQPRVLTLSIFSAQHNFGSEDMLRQCSGNTGQSIVSHNDHMNIYCTNPAWTSSTPDDNDVYI